MHILLAILGALGVIALILYRINALKGGAEEVVDTVERAAGAWRRHKFRKKAERPALETEDDPRAAAAAIALSIDDSAELLSYARWLIKDVVDPNTVSARIAGLLNAEVGDNEKRQLIDMLERLSSDDPAQIQAIEHLKTRLGMSI